MKYSTQHKYQCSEAYEKWKKLPYREQKKIDILLTKSAYKDAYAKGKEEGIKEGMERAADMLDLNYPLCAKWIRKEIE